MFVKVHIKGFPVYKGLTAHSLPGTFRSCFSFVTSFFIHAVCKDVSPGIDIKSMCMNMNKFYN